MHRGVRRLTVDEVNDALEAARNLLLFLHFYGGHGWALSTADARLLSAAARAVNLSHSGALLRLAWSDASTLSPLVRRAPPPLDQ